jgi:hypothetical protein
MKHPKLQRIAGIVLSISTLAATAMAGEIGTQRYASVWSSFCSFFGF